MNQLHKRFTAEQIKVLLQGYRQGSINRTDIQDLLGIGRRGMVHYGVIYGSYSWIICLCEFTQHAETLPKCGQNATFSVAKCASGHELSMVHAHNVSERPQITLSAITD